MDDYCNKTSPAECFVYSCFDSNVAATAKEISWRASYSCPLDTMQVINGFGCNANYSFWPQSKKWRSWNSRAVNQSWNNNEENSTRQAIQATDWLIGVLTSETTVSLLHNCLLFWLSSSLTAWVSLYNCCCRELLSYLFENCKITTTRRGTTCKNIKTDTREREGCSVATGCEGASSKLKTNSYVCLCLFCLCFEN